MQRRTRLILCFFLPLQIIILQILKRYPEFVELYYSRGIFPIISKIQRYVFGWIPFSMGDIFYVLLISLGIYWMFKNYHRLWKEPVWFFVDITATLSIIYFVFNVLWGLNYYREPLHKSLDLDNNYSTEQLINTTERLIHKSNELHRKLGYSDTTKIDLPYTHNEMFKKSIDGYDQLAIEFPYLEYSPRSIKKSGWSLGLTYMGYSGYYNPFSGEAQVNNLIKTYKFPVVSCHEEAHQLGYARENEANFIATLASLHNKDPYIQYSGYIFVLRYCINEIARRDVDLYNDILKSVNPGILKSYKEMRDFWASYQNPFERFSKHFWDQFLKANNQSRGIMSYSYMVALAVNYFDHNPI